MKQISLAIFLTVISIISLAAYAATCAQGSRSFCVFIQTTTVPIALDLTYQSLNDSGKYLTPPPSVVGPGSTGQFIVQIVEPFNTMGNVQYGFQDEQGFPHGCSISFNCSHGQDQECKIMSATASGSDSVFTCKASYTNPSGQESGTFTLTILNNPTTKSGNSQ